MTGAATMPTAGALVHQRILASAGSGKTYQLTNRYLALVRAGADPGSMLASTFTRLAAGQIRNRILLRLAEAVDDDTVRGELARSIGADALTGGQALTMLASLARDVHRVNIRTLDSFFASVVTAFALELGLPPGARMIDEEQAAALRTEAMRRMLDEDSPQRFITLLRLLTQQAATRSVMDAIDGSVSGLYELFREAPAEAWDCIDPPSGTLLTAQDIAELIERLATCALPEKKSLHKARHDDLRRLHERDWATFLSLGIAAKIAAGSAEYSRTPIPPDLIEIYAPLVEHAQTFIVNLYRDQTLASRELLIRFDAQYTTLKQRERVITFSDLAHAVLEAETAGRLQDICYRIDATIRHLLLDEFQDTSVTQWRALEPFVEEVVHNAPPEHTFFCVGDVKQSIYGWRDAAPDVLLHMPRLIEGADETTIVATSLETSWRSAPEIIDTVNLVFESVPGNSALADHPHAQATWGEWFKPHSTARKNLPGYATLRTAPYAGDGEKQPHRTIEAAAELVADLHRRAPARSIAVLARTNTVIPRLLFHLHEHEIPASGRGGGPLTDAPPVNVILDLLRLADHPDDTVAAFNVATSPLAGPLGVNVNLARPAGRSTRLGLAARVRRQLLDEGYARTVDRWVRDIASSCDARQLRRLMQLAEQAEAFDARASLRPGDFIAQIEALSVAEIRPAPVQVMTVHQAKGLEYDIVVMPELDSKLTGGRTPEVVFEREGLTGPINRICRYMKKDVQALLPDLAPLFEQEQYRTVRESLCVLYVAMTRARQGLYMLINPPKSNEKTLPKTIAGVLREALNTQEVIGPAMTLYEHGDESWLDTPEETDAPTPPAAAIERIELRTGGGSFRPGTAARPASAHGHGTELADALALRDDEPLDRGFVMHLLLEQVHWRDEFAMTDDELAALVRRHVPRRDDDWITRQVDAFRATLARPDVGQALSRRGRSHDAVRVWRELPYARVVDHRLEVGRIDRLEVELDDEGRPIRGAVIDFKTDVLAPGTSATDHAEKYREQLETYRAPAAACAGLAPEAMVLSVLFTGTGEVVTLVSPE